MISINKNPITKLGITFYILQVKNIEYKNNKAGQIYINLLLQNEYKKTYFAITKKVDILKKIKDINLKNGDYICILGLENIQLDKHNQKINISYYLSNIVKISFEEWENGKLTQNNLMELMEKFILNQNEDNKNNNQEEDKEEEEYTNKILNTPWELDI